MKYNYLIGLGGSGGKIVKNLYDRLISERGKSFENKVECIVIDTDIGDLKKLSGVNTIRIGDGGIVGDVINDVAGDVLEWCPEPEGNTAFYSSTLSNGASQCRLKSRLCLANFLKNEHNELYEVLENALRVSSDDAEADFPKVLIASSIAGGTGSGTFIQTALYVKKFFRDHGISGTVVTGLFACPDIYAGVVTPTEITDIYANAYAVVRELNAFSLICGDQTTTAYGGEMDMDIEISTDCEGKLFTKNQKGRYGEKPYDVMYFIDKVNCLSRVRGGINSYYKAMADIAYTSFYTDITKEIWSIESNLMKRRIASPIAIYGSAGAAKMVYPFDDIVNYFASRSISDGMKSTWCELDNRWAIQLNEKKAVAKTNGRRYVPSASERAEKYIADFEDITKESFDSSTGFEFLGHQVKGNDDADRIEEFFNKIKVNAQSAFESNKKIIAAKEGYRIKEIDNSMETALRDLKNSDPVDDEGNVNPKVFETIVAIDGSVDNYSKEAVMAIADEAPMFAEKIFCVTDSAKYFDDNAMGIINSLLKKDGEWIHPLAARYILYSLKPKLDAKIAELGKDIDKPEVGDIEDFITYLKATFGDQKKVLDKTNSNLSNKAVLERKVKQLFVGKSNAAKAIREYFDKLRDVLILTDETLVKALQLFALKRIQPRINALIEEYESFFDNLPELMSKASAMTSDLESRHDKKNDAIYVCSKADIKKKMFDRINGDIDTQTGEVASNISKAIFESLRHNVGVAINGKSAANGGALGLSALFDNMLALVSKEILNTPEISKSVDRDIFSAMVFEYELLTDSNDVVAQYRENDEVKNAVDDFIMAKFRNLSAMSAPALLYNLKDPYSNAFVSDSGKLPEQTTHHRYVSHNATVKESMKSLLGGGGDGSDEAFFDFYSKIDNDLPTASDGGIIQIFPVISGKVDDKTILGYEAVDCLQPYQISAFDELGDGKYYKNYERQLARMDRSGASSMTPHLDKRWHKRGAMPYINVQKELECRLDLAKAFLYMIYKELVGYDKLENNFVGTNFVYHDFEVDSKANYIWFDGGYVNYKNPEKVIRWLENNEPLISRYASEFDKVVEAELRELQSYGGVVSVYKGQITKSSKLLKCLRFDTIRRIPVATSTTGKEKTITAVDPIGIIELAAKIHRSEEADIDKNYGELILDVLCLTVKKYAMKPFDEDRITNKDDGRNSDYLNYVDVRDHIMNKFFEAYIDPKKAAADDAEENVDVNEQTVAEVEIEASKAEDIKWARQRIQSEFSK